jgi:arylformamidase
MRIYDISVTVTSELPVWPGDPAIVLERVEKIEEGGNANVSRIEMGVHTGTHVDAPVHFVPGASSVESMSLDVLVGLVQVVHLADSVDTIGGAEVQAAGIKPGTTRVLFKTRNSQYWSHTRDGFQMGFVGITRSGAEKLVEMGIRLVGIDYLSIAPFKQSRPTHEVLLKASTVIIEGLDLRQVNPGEYTLYCLPIKLGGSDGAPCRAILVEE